MKHELFEEWLFTEEPLSPQEQTVLQKHLQDCESCSILSSAWRAVNIQLHNTPMAAPAPGFTLRWQQRLQADRQRLERRQSLVMLGFSISGAILLLASLAILLWPALQSPGAYLAAWFYRLSSFLTLASVGEEILSALASNVTGIIPLTWWVILVGVVSELAVLWVVSYRLLTNPRRITQ